MRETLFIDRKAKAVSMVRTKINHKDEVCTSIRDQPKTISLVDPLADPGGDR